MSDPIHATCVAVGDAGVLITGPSGSGKSDLALRLIDRGARLVSDDYTRLVASDGALIASAPETITGRMEVRGVGIIRFPTVLQAIVRLLVRLDADPPRLPETEAELLLGISLPVLRLDPSPASAPIKLELALTRLIGGTR